MNEPFYDALNIAKVFADELAKAGIVLDVASGGALQELVGLALPVINYRQSDYVASPATGQQNHIQTPSIWSESIRAIILGKPGDMNLYGTLLDSCIHEYGKRLKAHIAYARGVVAPLAVSFAEAYLKYGEERLCVNPAREFEIEYVDACPAYTDSAFNDLFNRYGSAKDLPPEKKLELGTKNYEELLEMLSVGNARIDKLIIEWASKLPEGTLVNTWNRFFTAMTDYSIFQSVSSLSVIDKSNIMILAHLFARTILEKTEQTDLPLGKYEERVKQYLQWSGVGYLNSLGRLEQMSKSKTIVLETSSRHATILGKNYQEWLSQGGSPEIILGMLADGTICTTAASINENAARYRRAWENFETLQASFELSQIEKRKRQFLIEEFARSYSQYDSIESEYMSNNPGHREKVIKEVKKYVDSLRSSQLDAELAHDVSLEIVAGRRFSFTASMQILEDIKNVSKINPDADPRESALLAAVNYLSDFIYTMLSVRYAGI